MGFSLIDGYREIQIYLNPKARYSKANRLKSLALVSFQLKDSLHNYSGSTRLIYIKMFPGNLETRIE